MDAPFLYFTQQDGCFFLLTFKPLAFLRNIPSAATDAELVKAYREEGSMNVLGELYNRYMEMVYGICLKYLHEPEDAQDAVMAIFEELVLKLRQHQVENFKSWLYTLSRNHCLMRLRSQKQAPTVKMGDGVMHSEADQHLEDVLSREENLKQLETCLESLADNQRKVIELFYLQGKCYNEISAETGIDWSNVRSYIQNGRRNLRICMEGQQKKFVSNE
ncbi:sigma-70 family RNA polymerase sigma factor [Flavisolibacter sp. BT320]|nr:sigma-70 family RNA polymerase sigma factor [Flavisolibacter longurius]